MSSLTIERAVIIANNSATLLVCLPSYVWLTFLSSFSPNQTPKPAFAVGLPLFEQAPSVYILSGGLVDLGVGFFLITKL